jgi:hypothetical protein
MGLRKYFGLDRRSHNRHQVAVETEFQIWDDVTQNPRTEKVRGRLTDISPIGACLQTNHMLIGGYHLLLDNDPSGQTPLVLTLPAPTGESHWDIKAQVLWYNKVEGERRYQFDVGLSFVDVSPSERENLNALLKSHSSS